jgi:hypothetical protein
MSNAVWIHIANITGNVNELESRYFVAAKTIAGQKMKSSERIQRVR